MQHTPQLKSAPRRSLIWDEANARYIWLDPNERAVARGLRAKRAADFVEANYTAHPCALGEHYKTSDYDASTRQNAYNRAWSRRQRETRVQVAA